MTLTDKKIKQLKLSKKYGFRQAELVSASHKHWLLDCWDSEINSERRVFHLFK